jgi:hypothetical protein
MEDIASRLKFAHIMMKDRRHDVAGLGGPVLIISEAITDIEKQDSEFKDLLKRMEWLAQAYPEVYAQIPATLEYGLISRNEAQRIQSENLKEVFADVERLGKENAELKELNSTLMLRAQY